MKILRLSEPTLPDPECPSCALCGQPLDSERRLARVTSMIGWALVFAAIAFLLSQIA
jgi:hypothetical protein